MIKIEHAVPVLAHLHCDKCEAIMEGTGTVVYGKHQYRCSNEECREVVTDQGRYPAMQWVGVSTVQQAQVDEGPDAGSHEGDCGE